MAIALPKPRRQGTGGATNGTWNQTRHTTRCRTHSASTVRIEYGQTQESNHEACKQSGRNHLMEFGPVSTAKDYFQADGWESSSHILTLTPNRLDRIFQVTITRLSMLRSVPRVDGANRNTKVPSKTVFNRLILGRSIELKRPQ